MSDLIVGDSQKSEIWNKRKSYYWRFSKAALIRFLLASLIALFSAFLSIWPRFLFTLCWMFLGPAIWIDGFANFDIFHLVHPLQHALPRLPQQLLHRLWLPLLPESSLKLLLQLLFLLFNVVFQSEIFTLSNHSSLSSLFFLHHLLSSQLWYLPSFVQYWNVLHFSSCLFKSEWSLKTVCFTWT